MTQAARATPSPTSSDDIITWQDAGTFAALVLAGGWTGFFLFTGMPQLTLEVFPRTVIVHLLVGALAILYAGYLALARRLPGGSPLDVPVLCVIGAYALATFTSINWRVSLEATLALTPAILTFYALADLPLLDAARLRRAFMLTCGALSLYAIWVVGNDYANYLSFAREVEGLSADNIFPPTVPRVHDVSDHPNVLAMLLTLVMPFFAIAAYRPENRWERWGGVAGLVGGALAVFLTLSRAGWIGVIGGTTLAMLAAYITVRAHEREQQGFAPSWENLWPRDVTPTALAAIAGALALAVGGTLAFLSSSTTRPGWLFRSSLSPREDAWTSGLDMFADYPLTGSGPNTFGLLYPEYSGKFLVHTQHAHNGFLQAANDVGIVGMLAFGVLALAIVYMLFSAWRRGSLDQRLLAIACAGGLIGFSLHNQLDAGNIWKAPAMALAVVGAIIVRNYRELPERSEAAARPALLDRVPVAAWRYGRVAVGVTLLILLVLPFVAWYRIDQAHNDYWVSVDLFRRRAPGALERAQEAVDADSSMMVYRLNLGQMQATMYQQGAKQDQSLIDRAIVNLEQAVRLDKRSDLAHANLARAYELAGRKEDAAEQARLTRFAGTHVPPVLAVAEVYEDMGYEEDAISTYGQVLSMDAGLTDSTFWAANEWRREHFDEILESSILSKNPCTYGAYLVQARESDADASLDGLAEAEEGCKILVVNYPNDLVIRVALARIMMALDKDDEAITHLLFAVDRQPDFGPARTQLGRWHADRGDIETARRQWVIAGQLEQPEAIMELGNSYAAGQVPGDIIDRLNELLGGSGTSVQNDVVSILYYRLKYARISPIDVMIPGDWKSAVPRSFQEMKSTLERWRAEAQRGGPLPGSEASPSP